MTLEITLEADERLKREDLKVALNACGATDILEKENSLSAIFAESNMAFFLRDHLNQSNALTEGFEENGANQWSLTPLICSLNVWTPLNASLMFV